jgi:N-glycosylase/DNA lyase
VNHSQSSLYLPLSPAEPLSLAHSFDCGQIFRWRRFGDAWVGTIGESVLALSAVDGGIVVECTGAAIATEDVARFLGLHHSLAEIVPRIDTDPVMRTCLDGLSGLRLLRQDPWECLIAYICSSWNNIPKIQRSTALIAQRWGRRHTLTVAGQEVEVDSFPSPARLSAVTVEELRECGLGYRASYVHMTARKIAAGELDLMALRRVPYKEALASLLRLPGIGRKVADCILVFALDKFEAFPVDVWVRRAIHQYYGFATQSERSAESPARSSEAPGNREYDAIQRFAWDRWGEWAGYAQQYLFYAKRLGLI